MFSSRTASTDCGQHGNHKLIDDSELEAIVRSVRRAKQKKQDEEKWNHFLQSKYVNGKHANHLKTNQCFNTGSHSRENIRFTDGLTNNNMACEDTSLLPHGGNLGGVDEANTDVISTIDLENTTNEAMSHTYQFGAGLGKRLQDLLSTVTRMSSVLLNPGMQELEEEEDVDRTIKRCVEFDAMFARNHLYEIQRQIKEVKQSTMCKLSNTVEFESKISATVKCVTKALQVYTKHVSKGSRAKFHQTVPIFESISLINNLLEKLAGQHSFPLRQDIEVSCSYLKQILLEINVTETRTVSTSSRKPVRVRQKHRPSSDLSMYSRRLKNELKKKSAYLARAKFGTPLSKTHSKPLKPLSVKEKQSDVAATDGLSSITLTKSQLRVKAVNDANAKEVSFRTTTRAVSEEHVKTMMELIPNEPLEENQLCLDDGTFQTLKFLNEICTSKESNFVGNYQDGSINQRLRPAENKEQDINKSISVLRENVKLICFKEDDKISESQASFEDELPKRRENNRVLPLDTINGDNLPEYQQKLVQFITQSSQYKDGRTSVDLLANNILMDMVVDYQQEEMDNIVDMLYSLEFK